MQTARLLLGSGTLLAALALGANTWSQPDDGDAEAQALVLAERSKVAFDEQRYEDAIRLIEEAYRLKPEPVLLYNLGRAYQENGQFEQAIVTFERYLAIAGEELQDRAAIEERIAMLRSKLEQQKQREAKPPPAKPAPRPQPAKRAPVPPDTEVSPFPWVIAGVGAAGMIAGAVMGGVALSRNAGATSAGSQVEGQSEREGAEQLALGSTLALSIGGAILAGGAVWGIVDVVAAGPADDAAAHRTWIRVGLASATWGARF
jgi:tetratricopeptide (TPR) repeat protein